MKRSQMMALINKYFTELKGDKIVWDIQYPPDSSKLLDFLIDNGMQPPAYEKFEEYKNSFVPSGRYYEKITANEWEPE